MGGGWRPRREGLGRALAGSGILSWPLLYLPPPIAGRVLSEATESFIPTERFYDGNHFQVGKRDGNRANGFLKVWSGEELRQFLERRRKHTKKKGIKLSALREGLLGFPAQRSLSLLSPGPPVHLCLGLLRCPQVSPPLSD